MSKLNWKDIFMDEDAPEQPTVDLPDDNEEKGEDNGQGSEAAGALSEDGDSEGITNEPEGEDEITGTKSTEYDDVFSFMNKDDDGEDGDEDDDKPEEEEEEGSDDDGASEQPPAEGCSGRKKSKKGKKKARKNIFSLFDADDDKPEGDDDEEDGGDDDDKGEDDDKPEDGGEEDKPAEGCGGRKKSKKGKKARKNIFSIFDEDAPEAPTENLPDDNEEKGEDNGQGSEAAGALSEDDDPDGMKTEPAGEDEITGTKSTEYDDVFSFMDEGDEQPEDNDEENGDEDEEDDEKPEDGDGDDKPEAKKKGGKKKKARRNFWQDADDDAPEDGDEKKPEGEDPDKEDDDKPEDDDDKDDDENGDEDEKKDFFRFFDEGIEEPENLPGDPEPADPVDQNGKEICPIGNPDLPENLTEPVLEPVASENGETKELEIQNRRRISDRFFFN